MVSVWVANCMAYVCMAWVMVIIVVQCVCWSVCVCMSTSNLAPQLALLTLGVHAPEGYGSRRVCLCVCVC